ncbi:MAG TPA: PIN domain-containing protein [Chloroflexota bacterium]|nr:PIN domain-containing protein [Chloroflexota bacterium]
MSCFVDSSGLMAVFDANDPRRAAAETVLRRLRAEDALLVSTNYVVLETWSIAQRRFGLQAVRTLQADILPLLVVQWVDEQIHAAAVAALFASGRRQLSLVDCTSLEVMRRLGISRVFAFDPHFAEQGFEVLPEGAG